MHHIFSDPVWILECFWTCTFNLQVLMSVPSVTWRGMENRQKTSIWLRPICKFLPNTILLWYKQCPQFFLYHSLLFCTSFRPSQIYSHPDKACQFSLVSHHVWSFLFSFFFESSSWAMSFKTRLSITTEVSPDVAKA